MLVDFSSKKDIYIKHKNGSYTPMDEPYYEVNQIDDSTWQIMSSGDYHYLVVGDEEGIAVDTGYGAGNLREFLERLCGKPVRSVINTHHHFDHSANNCYFDKAYMAEEAMDLVSIPYNSFAGMDFYKNMYEKVAVENNDVISLKGRELIIFKIGDHTEDGIAVLDKNNRILFTGDEFMPGMKSFNGSVSSWLEKVEKVAEHRDEFDVLCGGPSMLDASEFDIFFEALQKIVAGEKSDEKEPDRPHMPKLEPYEGHKVYDCQMPHIEDIPKHGFEKEENINVFVYKEHVFKFREI